MTNLDVKSYYSFLSSTLSIKDIISFAIENGFSHASLIDINNMHGYMEFYKTCIANSLKPIIGWQTNFMESNIILIAKNHDGLRKIISYASICQEYEKIEFDFQDPDIIYISNSEKISNSNSNIYNYSEIACNPVYYRNKQDSINYHAILAIKNQEKTNIDYLEKQDNSQHLLKKDEIEEKFSKLQISNLTKLIDSINLVIPYDNSIKIKFNTDNYKKIDSHELLEALTKQSLKIKFSNSIPKQYYDRLLYELEVIKKLSFSDYFLIVWDFVKFAKKSNILVGPGRGSAAGSLVSYLLKITDVDPIKYDLIFERFLNPSRTSMPDIDVDISDSKRDLVLNHILELYGPNKIAQIVTFQRIKLKMAIRDIGRVLSINPDDIDGMSKSVPFMFDRDLEAAIKASPKLAKYYDKYPSFFMIVKRIIDFPRQTGIHAAGIIITDHEITNYIPIMRTEGSYNITQIEAHHLEEMGLVKFDILSLRSLTIITDVISYIAKKRNTIIDLKKIPLNDSNIYASLAKGLSLGIFQLESDGMRRILSSIGTTEFEDIVSTTSLYRPGPQQQISDFISRKKGKTTYKSISREYDEIVNKTHGILLYQEQVIKALSVMSGMDYSKADILRRAISKKDMRKIEMLKDDFLSGGQSKGYSKNVLNNVFLIIEEFANYGFNRSHAVAYSIISYWMAYLKFNYPIEFMSILMSYSQADKAKIRNYFAECNLMKINVFPVSINNSTFFFKSSDDNTGVYIPFTMIKGLGAVMAEKIVYERKTNGPFEDIIDFIFRMKSNSIPTKIIYSIVQASASDNNQINLKALLENFDKVDEFYKVFSNDSKQFCKEMNEIVKKESDDYTKEQKNELLKKVLDI
jgi:DNA polymerase III subunit alpha